MLIKKENNINKVFEIELLGSSYRILKADIINGNYKNLEIGNYIATESHEQAIQIGYSLEEQMKNLGYVDILDIANKIEGLSYTEIMKQF